ncbi:MAG: class I SAM-dependent methyltransferase [bacterium]
MDLIKCCPICKSEKIEMFLERDNVPVIQNFVLKERETARNIDRGDIKLAICNNCEFIFNTSFDLSKLKYGDNYDNASTFSKYYQDYIEKLTNNLLYEEKVQNCKIIEIGAGNGAFLHKLVEKDESNNSGIGFDPSFKGDFQEIENKLIFRKEFYGEKHANLNADVVILRHVLEVIPELFEVLKTIRKNLSNSTNAKVYLETPNIEWKLENKAIWDYCYEYFGYFSEKSLKYAFEAAGFKVDYIKKIFEGQYLWIKASVDKENSLKDLALNYVKTEKQILAKLKLQLENLKQNGNIVVWGAAGKGVTFLNLVDKDCKLVDFLVDINPNKQGKHIVGTGHIIIAPEEIHKYNIKTVIIMNSNYKNEIENIIKNLNLKLNLVEMEL